MKALLPSFFFGEGRRKESDNRREQNDGFNALSGVLQDVRSS